MTTANKITIARIVLIPVFVLCAVYYGASIREGDPDERWRWAAVIIFVVAAASDGLDGFIARRFHQRSRLGVILDPIADKGLLVAALLALSLAGWPHQLPLWFPVLVIGRDVILVAGTLLVNHLAGHVHIEPHWTGKTATFLTMVAIGWVMLQIPRPHVIVPTAAAGLFTFVSGVLYIRQGMQQIHDAGHGQADAAADPSERPRS